MAQQYSELQQQQQQQQERLRRTTHLPVGYVAGIGVDQTTRTKPTTFQNGKASWEQTIKHTIFLSWDEALR